MVYNTAAMLPVCSVYGAIKIYSIACMMDMKMCGLFYSKLKVLK